MILSTIKNENNINNFKTTSSIVNKLVSNTLNSIPEAIAICDKNGIILKINSKASRLFGWTDNELIEKKTFDILLTNRYRNNILYQLKTDPTSILDTTHFVYGLKKDGKTFPANLLVSSFSRDFLSEDRKTYLIVFSTSFIISQVKSTQSDQSTKTKFFDGNNYVNHKKNQISGETSRSDSTSTTPLTKFSIHSISKLSQSIDKKMENETLNNYSETIEENSLVRKLNNLKKNNSTLKNIIDPSHSVINDNIQELNNDSNKDENVDSFLNLKEKLNGIRNIKVIIKKILNLEIHQLHQFL